MAGSRSSRSTGGGFCPARAGCRPDQRREFALGWLNWLGAESLGVVVAILNLIWVPIVAFADIAIPDKILTLPIIASFVVSLMHFVVLYRLRVPVKIGQMLGAMVAAMSVQWTVSRAVANGLITEHLPFARTSKGGFSLMSVEFQAFWEAVIGVLLLVGAAVLVVTNNSTSRSARSMCSPRCWCWKACRSCRRWRSPSWRIRGSTRFRSGAIPGCGPRS